MLIIIITDTSHYYEYVEERQWTKELKTSHFTLHFGFGWYSKKNLPFESHCCYVTSVVKDE